MSNVLIRDVASDDLEQLRAAAAAEGTSLQHYLRTTVHAQAAYLRRRQALQQAADRLRLRAAVPEEARAAVLDAIDVAHDQRAAELNERQ